MIAILLADGFEEIEALTPLDVLRRAGLDARTVGIKGKIAVGSHKIPVVCDMTADEVRLDEVSTVILPGGMPGSLELDASPFTDEIINAVIKNGGRIAAICAAPLCLGRRGLLRGRRATCYPGFESELVGATVTGESVVTDGNITTARGMGVALAFAKELTALLAGPEAALEISRSVMEE
ncbi:MAG: DJ-1/PfpI family protein [Clostridia bacterium]|nr:DJ-1/PfpI family protein [Clostridia bacterium]